MGNTFSYPTGISADLISKLNSATSGADTFGGKASDGSSTLSSVTSDVSVLMSDISARAKGRSITSLASFWDGPGAIGQGGMNSGGVISDGGKASNFLDNLSGCMPGVSGNISDQTS